MAQEMQCSQGKGNGKAHTTRRHTNTNTHRPFKYIRIIIIIYGQKYQIYIEVYMCA